MMLLCTLPGSCSETCSEQNDLLKQRNLVMARFSKAIRNFIKAEDGPTAVEYAVMLALIIVVCITAITALGTNANATFTSVSNTLSTTAS